MSWLYYRNERAWSKSHSIHSHVMYIPCTHTHTHTHTNYGSRQVTALMDADRNHACVLRLYISIFLLYLARGMVSGLLQSACTSKFRCIHPCCSYCTHRVACATCNDIETKVYAYQYYTTRIYTDLRLRNS